MAEKSQFWSTIKLKSYTMYLRWYFEFDFIIRDAPTVPNGFSFLF